MTGNEDDLNILVVEDGEVFRRNISAGLRVLGYKHVACVTDGQAALEYLKAHRVDLIISDWYMEPVNGLELCKKLRTDPARSSVIFLMLSGESAKEKVLEAVQAGIDGYLVKPFTVNLLGTKIKESLKRRGKP